MKKKDWIQFKDLTEEKFKLAEVKESWGFQIQKNTKWNSGLNSNEIAKLEKSLGLEFPIDYIEMLKAFNGLETLQIAIDPDGKAENTFDRRCYKYPDDIEKTKWVVEDANKYIKYAKEVLEEAGFDSTQVEGFIPLYAHRALVVMKNKQESPVLSIWGNDIIIYGKSLIKYWCHEFHVNFKKPKYRIVRSLDRSLRTV